MTCVIQITGGKDVGKTVVAERLIKRLKASGKTVLAVKISHHDPEPPTKDTHRLRKAAPTRCSSTTARSTSYTRPQSSAKTFRQTT